MAVQDFLCDKAGLAASVQACPAAPLVEKDVCGKSGCNTISCLTRTTTFTQSVSGCIATVVYTNAAGAVVAIDGATSCPQKVEITNQPAAAAPIIIAPPIAVQATSCTTDVSVQAANALSQAVHTTPGTALLVKLCTPASQDGELVLLCKANGDKVALQYNVTVTPPALLSQFNLNTNAVDTTPISALVNCGMDKLDYGSAIEYCAAGISYTRIDVFDAQNQLVVGSIWQNEQGAQIAAPLNAKIGRCAAKTCDLVDGCLPAQTSPLLSNEGSIQIDQFGGGRKQFAGTDFWPQGDPKAINAANFCQQMQDVSDGIGSLTVWLRDDFGARQVHRIDFQPFAFQIAPLPSNVGFCAVDQQGFLRWNTTDYDQSLVTITPPVDPAATFNVQVGGFGASNRDNFAVYDPNNPFVPQPEKSVKVLVCTDKDGVSTVDKVSQAINGVITDVPTPWTGLTFGEDCKSLDLQHNPVWKCTGSVLEQAKAWYNVKTGALVRVNLLDGTDVTATWGTVFNEGQAPDPSRVVEYGFYTIPELPLVSKSYLLIRGGFGNLGQPLSSLPSPIFGSSYELKFTVDGNVDDGNGAGAIFKGNWPTSISSTQSFANLLNASVFNTAPKDTWAAAPDGETIYIVNTLDGASPNHKWTSIFAARSPTEGTGNFWLKGNNPGLGLVAVGPDGAGLCRKIEVVKTWTACAVNPVLTAYELDGTPVLDFNVSLLTDDCLTSRKIGIYLQQNFDAISMADIASATGSSQIMSVTVKQIVGTGSVGSEYGSGVPLSAGETWSWSAISGEDFQDTFSSSSLIMKANGGEQRITATVVA